MTQDPLLAAVDALAVELGIGTTGLAFTWDQLEAINGILHAHAHELAERIRNRPTVVHYGHGTFTEGSDSAADLIDPEVPS